MNSHNRKFPKQIDDSITNECIQQLRWKKNTTSACCLRTTSHHYLLRNNFTMFKTYYLLTILLMTVFIKAEVPLSNQIFEIELDTKETSFNNSIADSTMYWLQFMDNDEKGLLDNLDFDDKVLNMEKVSNNNEVQTWTDINLQSEETTVSWSQFMKADVNIEDQKRFRRNAVPGDGASGSGSGDTTTEGVTSSHTTTAATTAQSMSTIEETTGPFITTGFTATTQEINSDTMPQDTTASTDSDSSGADETTTQSVFGTTTESTNANTDVITTFTTTELFTYTTETWPFSEDNTVTNTVHVTSGTSFETTIPTNPSTDAATATAENTVSTGDSLTASTSSNVSTTVFTPTDDESETTTSSTIDISTNTHITDEGVTSVSMTTLEDFDTTTAESITTNTNVETMSSVPVTSEEIGTVTTNSIAQTMSSVPVTSEEIGTTTTNSNDEITSPDVPVTSEEIGTAETMSSVPATSEEIGTITTSSNAEITSPDVPATSEDLETASTNSIAETMSSVPVTSEDLGTATTNSNAETTSSVADVCNVELNNCSINQFCVNTASGNKCECVPGTTLTGNVCQSAKQFGGKLHIYIDFDSELTNQDSDNYKKQEMIYRNILKLAYGSETWFISVSILGFEPGSTVGNYKLVTKDTESVTSKTVEASFTAFVNNTTYFPSCSCDLLRCNSSNLDLNGSVLANSSCNDAGTTPDLLCVDDFSISQYCDEGSSSCDANLDGDISCQCKDGYVDNPNTINSCIQIVCTKDSDCNSPFGQCTKTASKVAGKCTCIWGFFGENCYQPWLFVLVIVVSGLLLIGIVVAVICIYRRKRRGRSWKKAYNYYDNVIYNNESNVREKYKASFEWEDQSSSIRPKGPYGDVALSSDYETIKSERNDDKEKIENPYAEEIILKNVGRESNEISDANGGHKQEESSWRVRENAGNSSSFTEVDLSKYSHQQTEM